MFVVDKTCQQAHPYSCQRSLVQHCAWHPYGSSCLRWPTRSRRAVLYRCCRRLRRFHDTHLHPRIFRRRSIQGWTLELGTLQHVHWRCGLCFCGAHGADLDASKRDWL